MAESPTPRQMLKGLLQGAAPPRPLFLPRVFSPGARVESQPLPAFLANPTKICSAQRQLRGPLRTDGFSCYFDPALELEALGASLQWGADNQPPSISWPHGATPGELPDDLRSPEEAVKSGRAAVAADVLRRMNSMTRDDSILMAGLSGPFTLAARLAQLDRDDAWRTQPPPDSALELAASLLTQLARSFVEAGANLLFIHEPLLPALTDDLCAFWASALEPAFNVIRFYQALPVLQLSDASSFAGNASVISERQWDCLLFPPLDESSAELSGKIPAGAAFAAGLPLAAFEMDDAALDSFRASFRRTVSDLRPAILTTAGDIPPATDMKRMLKVLEAIPRAY